VIQVTSSESGPRVDLHFRCRIGIAEIDDERPLRCDRIPCADNVDSAVRECVGELDEWNAKEHKLDAEIGSELTRDIDLVALPFTGGIAHDPRDLRSNS